MDAKKWSTLLAHALLVWAICGAIMFVGMAVTTMPVTLTVHAIGAPLASGHMALRYHGKHGHFPPVWVAAFFVATALFVDFFLVAMLVERSFEMFTSFFGLWLPMILIFLAAYLAGRYVKNVFPPRFHLS